MMNKVIHTIKMRELTDNSIKHDCIPQRRKYQETWKV